MKIEGEEKDEKERAGEVVKKEGIEKVKKEENGGERTYDTKVEEESSVKVEKEAGEKEAGEKEAREIEGEGPLCTLNRLPGLETIQDEDDRFRFDVASRPESSSLDDYQRIPVHLFGEALLRGMSWSPGQPIGMTNKVVALPIEYIPRAHRLGLGAQPKMEPPKKKKYIAPGESREPKVEMELPTGPDGKKRHFRSLDEKLVPKKRSLSQWNLCSKSGGGGVRSIRWTLCSSSRSRLDSSQISPHSIRKR